MFKIKNSILKDLRLYFVNEIFPKLKTIKALGFSLLCLVPFLVKSDLYLKWINKNIINAVFSKLNYESLIFIGCYILGLIYLYIAKLSTYIWVYCIILILIFNSCIVINRYVEYNNWSYSYFGLFFLFVIFSLISYQNSLFKAFIVASSNQAPLEPDKMERTILACNILDIIDKMNSDESFNFGILGKWGSGKTFFSNLIKKQIQARQDTEEGNKYIVVNFVPWELPDHDQFLLSLLKEIKSKLTKEITISNSIDKMIRLTQQDNPSYPFKILSYFIQLINPIESLAQVKQKLKFDLKEKKLIIFLDDLDRLQKDEILMVFKILRNSLNLTNTFFIVGFDRDYLESELVIDRFNEYCEKFFQIRIDLPVTRNIRAELANHLKVNIKAYSLTTEFVKDIDQNISNLTEGIIEGYSIFNEVKNLRDVEQISNSFFLVANSIGNSNCDLLTLLKLEILRYKFPEAYQTMASKKTETLDSFPHPSKGNQVFPDNDEQSSIKNKIIVLGVEEKMLIILSDIMNTKPNHPYPLNSHPYYDIYFKLNIIHKQIDQADFNSVFLLNEDEVQKKISDWFAKGQETDLIQTKMKILMESSESMLQKSLKTVFEVILKGDLNRTIGNLYLIGDYGYLLSDDRLRRKGIISAEKFRKEIFDDFNKIELAKILFTFGPKPEYKTDIFNITENYVKRNTKLINSELINLIHWYLSFNDDKEAKTKIKKILNVAIMNDPVGFFKCFIFKQPFSDIYSFYDEVIPNYFSIDYVIGLLDNVPDSDKVPMVNFLKKFQNVIGNGKDYSANISKIKNIKYDFKEYNLTEF